MTSFPALRTLTLAALTVLAGAAQAQFSSPVRDVENPDRFPYQERVTGFFSTGNDLLNVEFPTPLGRRHVIEFISVECTTRSGNDFFSGASMGYTTLVGPGQSRIDSVTVVDVQRRFFNGALYQHTGIGRIKVYSDANPSLPGGGKGIYVRVARTDVNSSAFCTIHLTGHSLPL